MSDDIVERLIPFVNDEMRMPAGLVMDVIEEIERLRYELENMTVSRDSWHNLVKLAWKKEKGHFE